METGIMIEHHGIRLEAVLSDASSDRAAVITHPHPLYGGDMHNPVVTAIADAFTARGFTTLRFNFRGTGRSSGQFDDGAGEQDDVRAAIDFLVQKGISGVWLAGYSFGSRVNASVIEAGIDARDHIMVSPPAAFMSFDEIDALPGTGLVITGAADEIAPPGMVEAHLNRWGISPQFETIEGCDHFYSGCLPRLGQILSGYLEK